MLLNAVTNAAVLVFYSLDCHFLGNGEKILSVSRPFEGITL